MVGSEPASAVRDLLEEAKHTLLVCHFNPDGDAAGSLLGLSAALRERFPKMSVTAVCRDPIPPPFHFLEGALSVLPDCDAEDIDLVVFLDSAEPKLTDFADLHPEWYDGSLPNLNVDHHPTNTRYARVNIVEASACSTAQILVALLDRLGWTLSHSAATCLLTGVFTDTGSLMHSNTTGEVYRTVARLLRAGAAHQRIVQNVFRTTKLSTLRLWGRVLEKIAITEEGGAVSAVTEQDFRTTGADFSELTGAIDYLNAVPGMRFSLILSERGGKVKGSLRTLRDDVDVSSMAQALSGGGHRRAAGFAVPGKLTSEVRWKVVPEEKDPKN